ncbi:thiamine biosynthesis protein ThiS [Litorimonas cladophorae]|uniref:Thiamine biosynthesis protein ThiS n=1 Tax=Litorimonas cladophorae TaxID=1220491 RepID=A0A918NCR9_9PROT|nr:thiamine biosynthesis protein ThiS [Litorimonas cladophorae]
MTLISTLGIVVHLLINGKDHDDLPDGLTVATLIAHLGLPERKIAVERNREVVPKSAYAETVLETNDVLEIIHFIGGG